MDAPSQEPLPESTIPASVPPQVPPSPPLPLKEYQGNQYDLYSLLAGVLGGSTLLMCISGGMAYYCLPIVPLILGIIALRRAKTAADPQRTRTLAWVGIAGGGLGTLFLLLMLVLLVLYFAFIFSIIVAGASGRR